MGNKIRMFWWNERVFHKKTMENFGDLLGKYLVEKISGKEIVFTNPNKFSFNDFFSPIYFTVGSILGNVNHKCIVWGSGIISKNQNVKKAKEFLAVRGPQSRKRLLDLGYHVPEVYGDPALLLPLYYHPEVEKKFTYGIVPHYVDYELVSKLFLNKKDILIIDLMTNNVENTTKDFLLCEKIISSSLHGIIIAHAYGIPAIWQKFSDNVFGDDIKYRDYFESVGVEFYKLDDFKAENLDEMFMQINALPSHDKIKELQDKLLSVCPFLRI